MSVKISSLNTASTINSGDDINIAGNNPLAFSDWGGGWYMQDSVWIRSYNNKSLWMNVGLIGGDGGLTIGYGGATPPTGGAIISGYVGIGTNVATAPLDVNGAIRVRGNNQIYFDTTGGTNSNYIGVINNYWLSLYCGRGNTSRIDLTNGSGILFSDNGSEMMRVASVSGNLLINTTTDAGYKLYVNGTGLFNGVVNSYATMDNLGRRINSPEGASYITSTSSVTGAIKIKLPVARNNSATMMMFRVKIYQYSTGNSYELQIGGYNYNGGGWYNPFVTNLTDDGSNFSVRFGTDATSDCVWIGETSSTWGYPQVFVTDFQAGYNATGIEWATGWGISFETAFDTVELSRLASQVITSRNIASQSVSYATTAGALTSMLISQFTNDSGYITSSALSAYLPLAGGTMTGALNITNANINLSNSYYLSGRNNANTANIGLIGRNSADRVIIDADGYGTNIGGGGTVLINPTGGNVGIGTTSPSAKLEVVAGEGSAGFNKGINIVTGNGTFTTGHGGILQFQNEDVITAGIRGVRDPGSWASSLLFYTHTSGTGNTFGTTFTEKMRITDGGNLLIGTTTDAGYKLDVNGTARVQGQLVVNHSLSGNYGAVIYNTSATGEGLVVRGGSTGSHTSFVVQPYDGSVALFSVVATGAATFSSSVTATNFIGAGTGLTGTASALSIGGNAATATNISNAGTVTLATATEANSIYITQPSYGADQPVKLLNFAWYSSVWSMGNIRSGYSATNGFGIYLNGSEKVRIATSGNFLINTTTDAGYKLDVNGTGRFTYTGGVPALNVRASDANFALASIFGNQTGDVNWLLMSGYPVAGDFTIRQSDTVNALTLKKTTGAATFSSSVTATSLIKSGGTSSQYLMADGSTSTLTNPITGTGTTNYLPKFTGASALGNSNLVSDANGNLGLGVTPSAWGSGFLGFDIGGTTASVISSLSRNIIASNSYYDGTNYIYKVSDYALQQVLDRPSGAFKWSIAPSGTAGNAITFTQAMTLTAAGNLLINTTTDAGYKLDVNGTARTSVLNISNGLLNLDAEYLSGNDAQIHFKQGGYNDWYIKTPAGNNPMQFIANSSVLLTLATSGAATFSSSVTASGNLSFGTDGNKYLYGFGGTQKFGYTNPNHNILYVGGTTGLSIYNSADTASLVRFLDNGNVLIGTTTDAGYKLDVNGTARTSVLNISNGLLNLDAEYLSGNDAQIHFKQGGYNDWYIKTPAGNNPMQFIANSSVLLTLATSGAATFSSSVTAGSLIKSGGTSSQYLMADGSVDSNAYALVNHTHDLGRYSLAAPGNIDGLTSTTFRTTLFGVNTNTWNLSTARWNTTPTVLPGMNAYGTMFAWSGSDTHGFIATDYSGANITVGGGNGNNINWTALLIHSLNIGSQSVSYATTAGALTSMNISQFTNDSGYITSASLAGYLPLTGGTLTGDLTVNTKVYVGTHGCYFEEVLIGSTYELRVVDSAGNKTVLS